MAEWTIATVCKTVARQGYLGSNTSLSTNYTYSTVSPLHLIDFFTILKILWKKKIPPRSWAPHP